jgi:aminopeptidase-like protein
LNYRRCPELRAKAAQRQRNMPQDNNHDMDLATSDAAEMSGAGMIALTRELCAFRTAVVADDNEALFARISRELPLELFGFESGETFNGWVVPQNWRVRRAKLYRDGQELFDGAGQALAVAYYSRAFSGELDWQELDSHLVSNAALPDALMFHCMWQYRPWDADWALSLPHRLYATLGPGRYRVEIETECTPGIMLVAQHHKRGRSGKTIVFNTNNCHPHMANDGFAGTAVLIRLMQWLAPRDTFYSYRLVIGPEHLGSVFYLRDRPRSDVDQMVGGIFEEMPGTKGPLKATATFRGGHVLDHAMANALRHHARAHKLVPWRKGAGNDETVWEAPGYEVPFVELTRCEDQFAPYREYHSSLDTPDLMDPGQMEETLLVLRKTVEALEQDAVIHRRFDGLVCLSNPAYNLYLERPDPAVIKDLAADAEKWGHLLDCLFRYFDGSTTILEIAERHDLPFDRLRRYLDRFVAKDLIHLERAEISRQLPTRACPTK